MTNVNQNTTQNSSNDYFNIHTRGLCYINRFREVPTRKGTFFSVTLGFLRGHIDEVEYTYIDTVIRNEEVLEILYQYQDAINAENTKVIAVATVGDIYADTFKKRNGDTVAGIKGRLIGLSQLKIDGQVVYQREQQDSEPAPVAQAPVAPVQESVAQPAPRASKQVQPIHVKQPVRAQVQNQAGQVVYQREQQDSEPAPVAQAPVAPVQESVAQPAPRASKQVQPIHVKQPVRAQVQNQASPVEPAPEAYQPVQAQVVQQAPVRQPVVAPANFEGEFLDVVKLDKNDPNFVAIKDQLKANGYRWNKELTAWVLAA